MDSPFLYFPGFCDLVFSHAEPWEEYHILSVAPQCQQGFRQLLKPSPHPLHALGMPALPGLTFFFFFFFNLNAFFFNLGDFIAKVAMNY